MGTVTNNLTQNNENSNHQPDAKNGTLLVPVSITLDQTVC
jgi:hypothetical protein